MWRWEREDGRYYEVLISRDLFNDPIVYKSYGGEKRKGTQTICVPCTSKREAIDQVRAIHKTRSAHGYELVVCDPFINIE